MEKTYKLNYAGREVTFEFNKLAKQSNTSVLVRCGETAVLVAVTASEKPKEGIDFFPLSVDYEEKMYAIGKIPGGYKKREGRPADYAILTGRAIDRGLRPLFPKDLRHEVVISCVVLSVEPDYSPEILCMIGASAALTVSDIPFNGPLGSVEIGMIGDEIILNPNEAQSKESRLKLTLSGTEEKIIMIESGANELTNEEMMHAIKEGHKEIIQIIQQINKIREEIGKEKFEYEPDVLDEELLKRVRKSAYAKLEKVLQNTDKMTLDNNISMICDEVLEELNEENNSFKDLEEIAKSREIEKEELKKEYQSKIYECVTLLEKEIVRKNVLEKDIRVDGRTRDEVRPLSAEVGLFARTHGSGLFSRGDTQVLSIATLAKLSDGQKLDGLDGEETKRYMHQYNFPGYSVGEAKPARSAGRREIGHGALAEKALVPVLPSKEDFPYAIRVVSEVMGSNGSTSQGSICGSTLALMDAGVPITKPVAGISAGLFTDENGQYKEVTDIQGIEDFFGDMDFKVAGTLDGITAIQVDIKNDGLTYAQIEEALERTYIARQMIINDILLKAIKEPRKEISKYALKIAKTVIDQSMIGELIGPAGKNINRIIELTGVEIDIEEDGTVLIYSNEQQALDQALELVKQSTKTFKVGEIITGKVVNIMKFGAFVDLGGKEGLLHISKISTKRLAKVEDELKIGQEVTVKITDIDEDGKISLDRKSLFE